MRRYPANETLDLHLGRDRKARVMAYVASHDRTATGLIRWLLDRYLDAEEERERYVEGLRHLVREGEHGD